MKGMCSRRVAIASTKGCGTQSPEMAPNNPTLPPSRHTLRDGLLVGCVTCFHQQNAAKVTVVDFPAQVLKVLVASTFSLGQQPPCNKSGYMAGKRGLMDTGDSCVQLGSQLLSAA